MAKLEIRLMNKFMDGTIVKVKKNSSQPIAIPHRRKGARKPIELAPGNKLVIYAEDVADDTIRRRDSSIRFFMDSDDDDTSHPFYVALNRKDQEWVMFNVSPSSAETKNVNVNVGDDNQK